MTEFLHETAPLINYHVVPHMTWVVFGCLSRPVCITDRHRAPPSSILIFQDPGIYHLFPRIYISVNVSRDY